VNVHNVIGIYSGPLLTILIDTLYLSHSCIYIVHASH